MVEEAIAVLEEDAGVEADEEAEEEADEAAAAAVEEDELPC